MSKRLTFKQIQKMDDGTYRLWRDGYSAGVEGVASYIADWDKQLAPTLNGKRFSDIILLKFNQLKRKKVRKVRCLSPATASDCSRPAELTKATTGRG